MTHDKFFRLLFARGDEEVGEEELHHVGHSISQGEVAVCTGGASTGFSTVSVFLEGVPRLYLVSTSISKKICFLSESVGKLLDKHS